MSRRKLPAINPDRKTNNHCHFLFFFGNFGHGFATDIFHLLQTIPRRSLNSTISWRYLPFFLITLLYLNPDFLHEASILQNPLFWENCVPFRLNPPSSATSDHSYNRWTTNLFLVNWIFMFTKSLTESYRGENFVKRSRKDRECCHFKRTNFSNRKQISVSVVLYLNQKLLEVS